MKHFEPDMFKIKSNNSNATCRNRMVSEQNEMFFKYKSRTSTYTDFKKKLYT